jgi:hypothetical protein
LANSRTAGSPVGPAAQTRCHAAVAIATEPREPFQVAANQGFYTFFANARVPADRFGLVFRAQTKDAVHIAFLTSGAMQTNERDANAYEVVIGGVENTQSMIRVGTQSMPLASVQHNPHAKTCDEFRPFWVWVFDALACLHWDGANRVLAL